MPGHKFYTSRTWRAFRELVIIENGGVCNRCHKVFTDTSQLEVHHIKHLKGNDYDDYNKTLNKENVEVICHQCHNEEHGRFITHKEVILVYGPPLSGKSTYVKENKGYSDIVVDLDKLQEAITLMPTYQEVPAVKRNLFSVRDLLLDHIKTRYGKWKTAWIIGGYPNTFDRDRIINDLQVDAAILMETTQEECLNRLENVNDYRKQYKTEWQEYISRWFSQYTPPVDTENE
jgi:adenylate kinase family enzyme